MKAGTVALLYGLSLGFSVAASPAVFAAQKSESAAIKTDRPAAAASVASNPYCLKSTGTLLRLRKGQCAPAVGQSYSRRDIDFTGAVTAGDALRDLDPSAQVSPP